jgi:hypothetical protein
MSQAEAIQLFAAAGFRIAAGIALNICNRPATPNIAYLDLNGDGRPEAVATDRNPACYGATGDWFTVVEKGRNGRWQAIMRDTGVLTWEKTRTNGWIDARRSGGGRCDRTARFNGSAYIQSTDCDTATRAQAVQDVTPRPAPTIAETKLAQSEHAAIFKAAGLRQRGGDWVGCDGNSTGSIEKGDIRDINGDGHPDAVVTEGGTACYGMTGQGFHLLSSNSNGHWTLLYSSPGIPEFLNTRAKGWPEVEVGGPGFCFPILRWNGRTYVYNRNHEYQSGACARRRQ